MMVTLFSPVLLNEGDAPETPLDQPIDIALTLSMADLKVLFVDSERGQVQYHAIRNSEQFEK
ncbi:MAG: hypothetical protein Q7U55_08645, partial [Deltaproteobacteria bacterium]|nr:hypothetical protein [Deltaproteobacteria bacterium]